MAVTKEVDINLIDMVDVNEDIFGYEDVDFLADDIKEEGFHGTIEVYAKKDGRYEISAGHRRLLAAKQNGMKKIPCSIEEDTDDITKAKRLVMSNVHQRKMTPYNWAKALNYYKEHVIIPAREKNKAADSRDKQNVGKTKEILAKAFNLSKSAVLRYMALLNLIPEFTPFIKNQNCNYTNYEMVSYQTPEVQMEVYDNLVKMAVNGDINTLSRTLIDQTVNRVVAKREKEKLLAQKANEELEKPHVPNFGELYRPCEPAADVPGPDFINPPTSDGFISFSDDMDNAFDEIPDEWEDEVAEPVPDYTADGEVSYYLSRINLILDNGGAIIKDKEGITKQLQELILRLQA